MNTGKVPTNIYIDLSKAFDTLDHSILLHKLNHYGIRGVTNNLLYSYISNRYQYVDLNGYTSSTKVVDTGVPQGLTPERPSIEILIKNNICVTYL